MALILDVHVQRDATSRGKFAKVGMGLGDMGKGGSEVGPRGLEEGHEANPNVVARGVARRGGDGYALPAEQFVYEEDVTYHGAGGQVGRRSVEERI